MPLNRNSCGSILQLVISARDMSGGKNPMIWFSERPEISIQQTLSENGVALELTKFFAHSDPNPKYREFP